MLGVLFLIFVLFSYSFSFHNFFFFIILYNIYFNTYICFGSVTFGYCCMHTHRYIFLSLYSCEMVIKVIAKGFVLNKYAYLRNPWNWLDFVVITSGYATIGMEVGNLAGLRTFRVLRALKTVSIMPGKSYKLY